MFNISQFLKKTSNTLDINKHNKDIVVDIIKKNTKISLSLEQFEIKNYTVCLNVGSALQNKIFIYKKLILDDFKKNNINIIDIR
ncbi:MAG: hypothetical protein WAW92_00550 [Minisyncoccia bacterium]